MYSDNQKQRFLIEVLKKAYNQADSYGACKTKKGHWQYWTSNDYPLQHGSGHKGVIGNNELVVLMQMSSIVPEVTETELPFF